MALVETGGYADALEAVSDGRADGVVLKPHLAQTILAERGITNLAGQGPARLAGSPWVTASTFMVKRDRPLLASLLDKALGAIDPGELQRLHQRWFGTDDLVARLRSKVQLTEAERAFIAEHRDVVLGVGVDWQPMIIENADGDTVALINQVLGTRIRFKTWVWADLVASASRREIDGLSASAVHPERAADFLFTDPYIRIASAILARSGNPLGIRSVADLAGKRVDYGRGNLMQQKLLQSMPGVIPAERDVLDALLRGQTDAMVGSETSLYHLNERDILTVRQVLTLDSVTEVVFSIRKDWPLLVSAINKVLTALPDQERLAIKRRYLPVDTVPTTKPGDLILDASERVWLDAWDGRLTYCFHPAWAPYDYLEDGKHRGTFRDYLDLVAQKLGVHFEPLSSGDWPQALRFAQEHRCDLVAGAVHTPDRERYLTFTSPYLKLTLVLVAGDEAPFVAGIEDRKGKPLGVPEGSSIAADLRARFPDQTLVEIQDNKELPEAIAGGQVYAGVITLDHAAELVEKGLGRFRIIGKLDQPEPISVAVRGDAPELRSLMEKAVSVTTQGEHDRISNRRTTFKIEQSVDFTRLWQILAVLGLIWLALGYRHLELGRLNRRLIVARHAADVANRAKGDYLANMSHEIRTPLNAVLNLAALGARGADPERKSGYLRDIERSGRSLLDVVNEILDFSRLEQGGDTLQPRPFWLEDLVGRVVSIAAPLAAEEGLSLNVDLDPGLGGRWLGDAHKIERVLVNLAGNAVKFTDAGEVRLTVRNLGVDGDRARHRQTAGGSDGG